MPLDELNKSSGLLPDLAALGEPLARRVDSEFRPLVEARNQLRAQLLANGEIVQFSPMPAQMPESMCAIDGARVREQMYAADLLVAVATTADAHSSKVHFPVDSSVWADVLRHQDGTDRLAEAAMGSQEVLLAARAPHDMRILDGSFVTPLIALREGLFVKSPQVRDAVANLLLNQWDVPAALETLIDEAPRRVLALAKSDSSNWFVKQYGEQYGFNFPVSDRFLATQILEPGEMMAPRRSVELINQDVNEPEGSQIVKKAAGKLREQYHRLAAIAVHGRMRTTYFKPFVPGGASRGPKTVLRFEYVVPSDVQVEDVAYAMEMASIVNSDVIPPFMLEPFCQYTVDRQAKQISTGTRALRERMISSLPKERADAYRALLASGYRT